MGRVQVNCAVSGRGTQPVGCQSQGHFTLRRQTGIDSRGGEHRTGSGRLVPFLERTGRCQGTDQGVLTDLGLVLGQREMALCQSGAECLNRTGVDEPVMGASTRRL